MLITNVYRCSEMYEGVNVRAVVCKRPKFLHQLGLEERFDVVPRPLEAPEGDVILRDQPRVVVEQEPHCSLEVRKKLSTSLKLRRTINLNRDRNRTPIEVAKVTERNYGRVYG